MVLGENIDIEVFSPDFTPLGTLERRTALTWTEKFTSYGEFEIWCPITEKNATYLQKDNYIWLGSEKAGVIEYIEKERNSDNEFEFHVKGRMCECKLEGRVVYPMFEASGTVSEVMYKQVDKFCINPDDKNRVLSILKLPENQEKFGDNISYRQTGSDLLEEQKFLAEANNVGFQVEFDPFHKNLLYRVVQPTNRTWNQSNVNPVVFDSANDEILESTYTVNWANGRNVAIVAGEGEGSDRKVIEVMEGEENKPYYLTNLVTNGSFEDGLNGWNKLSDDAGIIAVLENISVHGMDCISIKGTTTNTYSSISKTYVIGTDVIAGHKYYTQEYACIPENNVKVYSEIVVQNQSGGYIRTLGNHFAGDTTRYKYNFQRGSFIFTCPEKSDTNYQLALRPFITSNVTGAVTCYVDGLILVDLTKAFGEGNEPDISWCDIHLSYFDGTIQMTKNSYVVNNLAQWGDIPGKDVISDFQYNGTWHNYAGGDFGGWVGVTTNMPCSVSEYGVFLYTDADTFQYKENTVTFLPYISCTKNHLYYVAIRAFINSDYDDKTIRNNIDFYPFVANDNPESTRLTVNFSEENECKFASRIATNLANNCWSRSRFDNNILSQSSGRQWCAISGIVLVDLTETFGEGNEPNKEWCDKYLGKDFFLEKNINLKEPSSEKRKELWVDARDLQQENSDGFKMSDREYVELLWQRGLQKLSEYKYVESFNSTIKTFGFQQNVYGQDYFLGDTVTLIDRELGVTMDTQVTEVTQTWDDNGYTLEVTFGNPQPTILDVVKRQS